VLLEAAVFNTIGGADPADRNLISGNHGSGVELRRSNENVVLGNFIGTDATGTRAIGNGWAGVLLRDGSQSNTIGGRREGQGNLLSGNSYGVQLTGLRTLDNLIQGNLIGTDVSSSTALPNAIGVSVRGAWRTVVRDNTISGNTDGGIHLWEGATGNTIVGNRIGTAADGVAPLGNGAGGIRVEDGARLNRIGGPGEGNRIAYNAGPGVAVTGRDTAGNTISGNRITANQGPGILLAEGGNGELPAPAISLTDIRQCVVSGTAPPNTRIEIFSDPEDEGQHFEGFTRADPLGRFWWRGGFRGPHVTATATDSAGNTSEFAAPVAGRCYAMYLALVAVRP
jgi:parallel beta-helix repeat protein